jgi:hypothetical protein
MEFMAGVALIVASLYAGTNGHPALSGALGGLAILSMGGGLWRRKKDKSDKKPAD